jgi:hypothetical protein
METEPPLPPKFKLTARIHFLNGQTFDKVFMSPVDNKSKEYFRLKSGGYKYRTVDAQYRAERNILDWVEIEGVDYPVSQISYIETTKETLD